MTSHVLLLGKTIVKSQVSSFWGLDLVWLSLFSSRVSPTTARQQPGDEEEAASIPLQLMMQGIFDAILMRASPRIGRWRVDFRAMISTLCVDGATRLIWWLRLDWIRIVSFCGHPSPSQLADESKVLPELQWISLKRANYHGKGHVECVMECNNHSAVTKVWCWKLMSLVVGKNYAKRFVNLWIASWLSWLWRCRWVTLDGHGSLDFLKSSQWSFKVEESGEPFNLSALEPDGTLGLDR